MVAVAKVCLSLFMIGITSKNMVAQGVPTKSPTSIYDYYDSVDFQATDDILRQQLQDLISPHTVLDYDDVWNAFTSLYVYLPNYPCDKNVTFIPDVYSSNCWDPEKILEGRLLVITRFYFN